MRKILLFVGVLLVFLLMAYMEEPLEPTHSFVPNITEELTTEDSEEVSADVIEPTTYSLEYVKESTKIENGYLVETYREYEIYEDEEGNVIKKEPTDNVNFLRYELEQE